MLIPLFSEAARNLIIALMVMPSMLSGVVGILGALATELTDKWWLKTILAAIPAIIYLLFCPTGVVLLVILGYILGFTLALFRLRFSF